MAYRKPWPPGVSGNPGGAPTGKRISTWMVQLGQLSPAELERLLADPKTSINARTAAARLKKSMQANGEWSTQIVQDRTEGSVAQTLRTPDLKIPQTPDEIKKFDEKWSILRRNLGLDKSK